MKSVLVTGANRGLGLELVKKFSAMNWQVFAGCRNPEEYPNDALSNNIEVLELDVASKESQNEFVERIGSKTKSLDVLINNAGVYDNASDGAPVFHDMDKITPIFQINAIAPRLLSDKLANLLNNGDTKCVITISSYMGSHEYIDEFDAKHWPYSASKAATNYSMDAFGFLHPNIKSILISPGWMKTRLGGDEAPYPPSEIAAKLFELVSNLDKVGSRKLYDINGGTNGKVMEW